MAEPPPVVNAQSVKDRVAKVASAHGSIHHHAHTATAAHYQEIAERVKRQLSEAEQT